LLAGLRWKTPEGRLLVALSLVPQNSLPYDLVPLTLIPRNAIQMGVFVVGSWLAVGALGSSLELADLAAITAKIWPVMLGAVYLPMLYFVLRAPRSEAQDPSSESVAGTRGHDHRKVETIDVGREPH
jgi:hypothetical protein